MKKHFLLTALVLPLTTLAAVLMFASLHIKDPWRSLLVNMVAGLLGSMITVFYVETIIRRNEERKWATVGGQISAQMEVFANGTATAVRLALGLEPPLFASDKRQLRKRMIQLIGRQLMPGIGGISNMDVAAWRTFANSMAATVQDADRILSLFSGHLAPAIMESLLDIREKARALLIAYQTWPDMLGVPFSQMKSNNLGESIVPHMKAILDLATKDAKEMLEQCEILLRKLDERSPAPNLTTEKV